MKSVLFIGSGAPWLGGAGYLVRQRMFLRALGDVARVHFAAFDLPEGSAASAARPPCITALTALPKVTRKPEGGLQRLWADYAGTAPRMFRASQSQAARAAVAALRPEQFDAVFAFRIDFAHFAGVLGQPALLLDIDDPEHLRWRRQLAATTVDGGDRRTLRDLEKLARFERNAARGALAAFVCQEHDRAAFDPLPIVVPNCVDVPASCPPRRAASPRLVLLGNFAAASPNVDALRWTLDAIWPLVLKAAPEAELHIVGKLSGELEKRATATPGVVARGFVSDLGAVMAEASASIAPVRFGTGTRVKIIESFALGCPVVSTILGAEGINARPDEQILIGDAPADFAKQCVRLLADPVVQERLAVGAYALAAASYSEQARRPGLSALLAELIDRSGARRPTGLAGGVSRMAALV